jgi:hypothetical protein
VSNESRYDWSGENWAGQIRDGTIRIDGDALEYTSKYEPSEISHLYLNDVDMIEYDCYYLKDGSFSMDIDLYPNGKLTNVHQYADEKIILWFDNYSRGEAALKWLSARTGVPATLPYQATGADCHAPRSH